MQTRKIIIIGAANEAPDQVKIASAINGKVIEGKFVIPFGMWPVEISNEKGEKEKVVQRLTADTAKRMVNAFNTFLGRFSRLVGGAKIYRGHPDQVGERNPTAWSVLGKIAKLEVGDNALVIHGDLPDSTKTMLATNEALAPSPYWGMQRTQEKQGDLAVFDPVVLFSLGITPRPNIAGAAANETPSGANEADDLIAEAERGRQLSVLAAMIADLESQLGAVTAERDALRSQLENVTAMCGANEQKVATAQAQIAAESARRQAAEAAAQAAKDALQNACNAVADAAASANLILPADKEHWAAKLVATPGAANELVTTERMLKTESIVSAARIAAANEALGGVSAAKRFEAIVRERMAKTGEKWPEAFNACRGTHSELYNLMPNGGRA